MTEKLTPHPQEVWQGADGTLWLIYFAEADGRVCACSGEFDSPVENEAAMFATAKRVFPPVSPQPQGETHGQSHCLDVDHFERVRSLHRVVRALHDGECPNCHRISNSERVRQINRNECPHCRFTITADEMDAVSKEFAPVMAKNLAVFDEWRETRMRGG